MKQLIYAVLAISLLLSCDKEVHIEEAYYLPIASTKSLDVRLTDNGSQKGNDVDFQGLSIELLQLRIKTEQDSGWIDLDTDAGIYDLVQLQMEADTLIASGTLEGDSIKELRLILGDENHVLVDSVWHDITIPSGSQSGLKLKFKPALYINTMDTVMVDFNASASVRQQGNGSYKLKPVIKVE